MAERIGTVWALDLGTESLKALHLSNESGALEVIGFDNVPHGKILTGTGVKDNEKEELIALTIRQFVQQNEFGNDDIIIAVPSQNSFARFVTLPPVEPKKIPEIVRFEASQQIPFAIDEVTWDWQMMSEEGAAEAKVGIFAIKNDVVVSEIEHFTRENMQVGYVQISPMALYNYLVYDRPDLTKSDTQGTVVMNIGAESTDLVVCTRATVWQRTIPMGGNAFTKAIADTFKLNFEKAEKLKRTAPMSKYARQILQAMKPVFADLASEIQRSLGFYTSSNANVKLTRIIAMGGGTKMRGLLQYLQQSLQIPIERPDSFKRLTINAAVSAPKFHENVGDFGIVYGLAVQALGGGRIESNLLPRRIARSAAWARKTKYFVAASCLILLGSALAVARVMIDRASYSSKQAVRDGTRQVMLQAQQVEQEVQSEQSKAATFEAAIANSMQLFERRDVVPALGSKLLSLLPNAENTPDQKELYEAFANKDAEAVKSFAERKERKQVFVTGLSIFYSNDLENAQFGAADFDSGMDVTDTGPATGAAAEQEMLLQMLYGGRGGRGGGFAPPPGGGAMIPGMGTTPSGGTEGGFVVTIVGYSPYKDLVELLDPPGVQNTPEKWGFITRLLNLDRYFDGNSPFELYKRTDSKHFELQQGDVDTTGDVPVGVGIRSGQAGDQVVTDPMTKETISRVQVVDAQGRRKVDRMGIPEYETRDKWFVLNLKMKWKDRPGASTSASSQPDMAAMMAPPDYGEPAPAPAAPARKSSGSSSRRKSPAAGIGDD